MKKIFFLSLALVSLMACTKNENPLLVEQNTPYGVPAFDQVKIEHYLPAFEKAIAENEAEIAAIANNPEAPTFANTIEALDRSGELLNKVVGVFFNVIEADGNDEMNAIAAELSPKLSALNDGIILNEALFQRVKAVYDERENLGLNDEQMRLLTETFKSFANNGANLPEDKKARLKEINQELGLLELKFSNNVVAETNAYQLFITDEAELKGLPESAKAAAKEEATAAGRPDAWLFTPKRTSFTPVLHPKTKYTSTGLLAPSPYLGEGPNPEYSKEISGYNNALSDFNGLSNTETLVGLGEDYAAANACWKYKDGASNLQWYLPGMGELGYLMPRWNEINSVITALGGAAVHGEIAFLSSSEHSSSSVYCLYSPKGLASNYNKGNSYYFRPFATIGEIKKNS